MEHLESRIKDEDSFTIGMMGLGSISLTSAGLASYNLFSSFSNSGLSDLSQYASLGAGVVGTLGLTAFGVYALVDAYNNSN